MGLAEVLSRARDLSRPDQLQLIEALAADLRCAEAVPQVHLAPGRDYPVWSPDTAYGAAAALLAALDQPASAL